jgi:hypothetical protein
LSFWSFNEKFRAGSPGCTMAACIMGVPVLLFWRRE